MHRCTHMNIWRFTYRKSALFWNGWFPYNFYVYYTNIVRSRSLTHCHQLWRERQMFTTTKINKPTNLLSNGKKWKMLQYFFTNGMEFIVKWIYFRITCEKSKTKNTNDVNNNKRTQARQYKHQGSKSIHHARTFAWKMVMTTQRKMYRKNNWNKEERSSPSNSGL